MIKNFEPGVKSNLKKAVSLVLVTTVCTVSVFRSEIYGGINSDIYCFVQITFLKSH